MQIRKTHLAFGKPDFGDAEVEAVTRVLRSGWVGMGPETVAFDKQLAGILNVPHAVAVNSCAFIPYRGVAAGRSTPCE